MKAKQISSKQTKSENLYPFRVVVRGTKGVTRKRKVFTTMARDEAQAAELAQPRIEKACKHFDDLYINVFAPLTRARKAA